MGCFGELERGIGKGDGLGFVVVFGGIGGIYCVFLCKWY